MIFLPTSTKFLLVNVGLGYFSTTACQDNFLGQGWLGFLVNVGCDVF